MAQHPVEAHQPAHGAAPDKGVLPVRQGAEALVDVGLQVVDVPLHGFLCPGLIWAAPFAAGIVVKGRVLREPAVIRVGVAFQRHHNQRRLCIIQIPAHAPALAVGGVVIKKDILPVKHVEHGIAPGRLRVVAPGKIYVKSAFFLPCVAGIGEGSLLDHRQSSCFQLSTKVYY